MRPEEIAEALSVLRVSGLTLEECKEISRKIGERRKPVDNAPLPTTKEV